MQIIELAQFRDDIDGVLAKVQNEEVLICDQGAALAVVSKPKLPVDWQKYWEERERLLAEVTVDPDWDSTLAVSEDRDRG
jgi:hypothetical protein